MRKGFETADEIELTIAGGTGHAAKVSPRALDPDFRAETVRVGYDPNEHLRPREVFYSGGFRSGSALEFQIQDACVLLSLLLQHGHRPEDIGKSLARTEQPDGSMAYASMIGLIVEELIT